MAEIKIKTEVCENLPPRSVRSRGSAYDAVLEEFELSGVKYMKISVNGKPVESLRTQLNKRIKALGKTTKVRVLNKEVYLEKDTIPSTPKVKSHK